MGVISDDAILEWAKVLFKERERMRSLGGDVSNNRARQFVRLNDVTIDGRPASVSVEIELKMLDETAEA